MFSYTPLFVLLAKKKMSRTKLRELTGIGTGTLQKFQKMNMCIWK